MAAEDVLTQGLLDDEAVLQGAPLAEAVTAHLIQRTAAWGSFVVGDDQLAATGRLVPAGRALDVCAVSSAGAGSLLSLSGRRVPGVEIVAARTALRDVDDLAGNAARVVAAAGELAEEVEVRVGLPYVQGWIAAAEVVEAGGLIAAIAGGADAQQLAEQLSALVELDLPFTVGAGPFAISAIVIAVDALIDGADPAEAAAMLATGAPARLTSAVQREDPAWAARIRRRLRAIGCADVAAAQLD